MQLFPYDSAIIRRSPLMARVRTSPPNPTGSVSDIPDMHPDFETLVICGALFRAGFEDPDLILSIAGMRKTRVILRIIRILQDMHASICYFEFLDRCEVTADGSVRFDWHSSLTAEATAPDLAKPTAEPLH